MPALETVIIQGRQQLALFAAISLFTLSGLAPAVAAPNFAREKWASETAPQAGSFSGESTKTTLALAVVGLGALAVFAYWYAREWYLNRKFRSYRIGLGPNAKPQLVQPGKRASLVTLDRNSTHPAADLTGMCVPSARPAVPSAGKPALRPGVLNVRAEDELHEIFVDNEFVGMTPAKLTLAEGPHAIEVKRAGRKNFHREIRIIPGAEVNLRPVLDTRTETAPKGATP